MNMPKYAKKYFIPCNNNMLMLIWIFLKTKKLGGEGYVTFRHPVYYKINIFQLKRIL